MTDPRTFADRAEPGPLGEARKAHYGSGKQPWDDIVESGWAPEFAAGCVLRYLRRDKDREHSIESARWYRARLDELMRGDLLPCYATLGHPRFRKSGRQMAVGRASSVLVALQELLTAEERAKLKETP